MAENKKTPVIVDNVTYYFEDMGIESQTYVNHLTDLDRKINNAKFNLDQLNVGKQAFVNLLKTSLNTVQEQPVEASPAPAEVPPVTVEPAQVDTPPVESQPVDTQATPTLDVPPTGV